MSGRPVATGAFAGAAPASTRMPPAHARGVIGALKALVPAGSVVVDHGAGTGILTGQLHRAQLQVLAVDSSRAQLEQLARTLPDVPALLADDGSLPLRAASVGALAVDEEFGRTAAHEAVGEIRRVLSDGGVLALVCNSVDPEVDWAARYDEALRSEALGSEALEGPEPSGRSADRLAGLVTRFGGFTSREPFVAPNPRPCGPAQLLERAAASASVASADPAGRERILRRVGELLRDHPDLSGRSSFELPQVTELWVWTAS